MISHKTIHLILTEQSSAQLRAKQSVRTTFRLSEKSIQAITLLSKQLGIRQKSIFDHLAQDLDTPNLENIQTPGAVPRIAKTFVISRGTLERLEKISGAYNVPRDFLMEHAIERILPLLKVEKQKHTKRKAILEELNTLTKASVSLFEKSIDELGQDDPVNVELYKVFKTIENSRQTIKRYIDRNDNIEKF